MSAIDTLTAATAATSSADTAAKKAATAQDIQDRFLKLLITQMKNQDPLNPLDNAQITTQLAQINTVNGIATLNDTVNALSSAMLSSQSLQSASLIGHTVVTEGNKLLFGGSAAVFGGAELAQNADKVSVAITGPAGNVVRQLELGPRSAGLAGFEWDGKNDGGATVAPGAYTFQITALSGGQKVVASPVAVGTVSGITLDGTGLRLNVDGVGDIQMSQVKSIL